MTEEEDRLWYNFLKDLPFQFYRQKIIENFIVDFYCPTKKIVIEIDGSQHYEDDGKESDIKRDERLSQIGIKVLRYSNLDVLKNFKNVCEDIYYKICDEK
jgi:very-short-patch-repair endonuclease